MDMTALTPDRILVASLPLDRQRALLSEDELRAHVSALIKDLSYHWAQGVDTAVDLGVALAEKCRRLIDGSGGGGGARREDWRKLAAWLEAAACEGETDESSFTYVPLGDDCRRLVLHIASLNDDAAIGRPGFLDIADIVAKEESADLGAGLPHDHEGGARTITTQPGVGAAHIDRALRCPCGKDLRPCDVDASSRGVRIICRGCHKLLLELELAAGSRSEGELVS
jgi:hypothetical protein